MEYRNNRACIIIQFHIQACLWRLLSTKVASSRNQDVPITTVSFSKLPFPMRRARLFPPPAIYLLTLPGKTTTYYPSFQPQSNYWRDRGDSAGQASFCIMPLMPSTICPDPKESDIITVDRRYSSKPPLPLLHSPQTNQHSTRFSPQQPPGRWKSLVCHP